MARKRIVSCDRCGHAAEERDFKGMDMCLFDDEDTATDDDSFTLCTKCVKALREWMNDAVKRSGE